jgi:GNAT superfamily N-acetyltransferase
MVCSTLLYHGFIPVLINKMNVNIIEANDWKWKKRFIDFPHDLYEGDPNYVPEIFLGQKELFDERKNPFFKHSKVQLYLALREGKIVGRIAAIRNNNYNEFAGANAGFFGFFDIIEEYDVAKLLLDKACAWLKKEGLDKVIGPANFSTNDTAGLLVEGFDSPPVVMMTYNKPYYADFLERYGFHSQMDLLAYHGNVATANKKSIELSQRLKDRLAGRGITFRNPVMRRFKEELGEVRKVYKNAWDKNWGFVPPDDAEFDFLAEGLKMIIDPRFAVLAEHEGALVGFALAVPDINTIVRTMKRGRLFPFGIFKLLLKKSKVKSIRIILLGVLPAYRKLGIEGIFYATILGKSIELGHTHGEASWILDNNEMMKKGIESVGMKPYKRYRMYEKPLAE